MISKRLEKKIINEFESNLWNPKPFFPKECKEFLKNMRKKLPNKRVNTKSISFIFDYPKI